MLSVQHNNPIFSFKFFDTTTPFFWDTCIEVPQKTTFLGENSFPARLDSKKCLKTEKPYIDMVLERYIGRLEDEILHVEEEIGMEQKWHEIDEREDLEEGQHLEAGRKLLEKAAKTEGQEKRNALTLALTHFKTVRDESEEEIERAIQELEGEKQIEKEDHKLLNEVREITKEELGKNTLRQMEEKSSQMKQKMKS